MEKLVIAGASGFVGFRLLQKLPQNYQVTALSRSSKPIIENASHIITKQCDLFSPLEIENAIRDHDVAIYLVHSMLPTSRLTQASFNDLDLLLADNFARACKKENIKHIIYLSGIVPDDPELSLHLFSRLEVEKSLRASGIPVTCLRAGVILGRDGSSFEMIHRLVKRLPAMILPVWTQSLSSPVSIEQVLASILDALHNEKVRGETWDLSGPEVVSYKDLILLVAKVLDKSIITIELKIFAPKLSLWWVKLITGAPMDLIAPLVSSLKHHLVADPTRCYPLAAHSFGTLSEIIAESLPQTRSTPRAYRLVSHQKVNKVQSVQRLRTLLRSKAAKVAQAYFTWLPRFYFNFIRIETNTTQNVNFKLAGIKAPLLTLEYCQDRSSEERSLYYIRGGLLATPQPKARIEFRNIISGRFTIVAIHDFVPRLPWPLYRFTQAIIHAFTMRKFNQYLLKKRF